MCCILTNLKDQSTEAADASEIEEQNVAMINEMVYFGFLLRRISKEIYHDSKGLNMSQKSGVAIELDALLKRWRDQLPEWLNLDSVSFREPEWASKQKVVLQLSAIPSWPIAVFLLTKNEGYLNARILLHRPFLATSTSKDFLSCDKHVEPCLEAARETIRVLYDSYANRHYFRTW